MTQPTNPTPTSLMRLQPPLHWQQIRRWGAQEADTCDPQP
jgi:hypothetical protein